MTVADYAAKFQDLSKLFPHCNEVGAEGSKCIKFESGICLEIKQFIGYEEIRQFSVLVNKCCIYDEDIRVRSTNYKILSDKRSSNQNREKSYDVLDGKGNQKFQQRNNGGKSQSEGGALAPIKCFKCGVLGHRASKCTSISCFKYGKVGDRTDEYKSDIMVYFNYGETGHISIQCQKPKKMEDVKAGGKVFSLSGAYASKFDNLI